MQKSFKMVFILFSFFFIFPISSAFASLVSTFTTGDDGWRSVNDVTLTWQNSGGNPGGFLMGVDASDWNTWYYVSPVSWSGDWTAYVNGSLEFDLKLISTGEGNYIPSLYKVLIYGNNGGILTWLGQLPGSTWTHYSILLNADTFNVSESYFLGVMADVKEMWIRGEYSTARDIEGLDNVRINPVPLPGTIWILGPALVGLARLHRRKDINIH